MQVVNPQPAIPIIDYQAGIQKNGDVAQLYEGQLVSFSKRTLDSLTRQIFLTLVGGDVKEVIELLKQLGRACVIVEALALAFVVDEIIDRLVHNSAESVDDMRQVSIDLDPLWAGIMALKNEIQSNFASARDEEPAWYSIVHQTMEFARQFQLNPVAFLHSSFSYDLEANENYRAYRAEDQQLLTGESMQLQGANSQSRFKRTANELERWLQRTRERDAVRPQLVPAHLYSKTVLPQTRVVYLPPGNLQPLVHSQTLPQPLSFIPGNVPLNGSTYLANPLVQSIAPSSSSPLKSSSASLFYGSPPPAGNTAFVQSQNPMRASADAYQLPTILEKSEFDDARTSQFLRSNNAYRPQASNNYGRSLYTSEVPRTQSESQIVSDRFAPGHISPSKGLASAVERREDRDDIFRDSKYTRATQF